MVGVPTSIAGLLVAFILSYSFFFPFFSGQKNRSLVDPSFHINPYSNVNFFNKRAFISSLMVRMISAGNLLLNKKYSGGYGNFDMYDDKNPKVSVGKALCLPFLGPFIGFHCGCMLSAIKTRQAHTIAARLFFLMIRVCVYVSMCVLYTLLRIMKIRPH